MNIEKNKSFCIIPWTSVSVGTTGSYRLCCVATKHNIKIDNNIIKIQVNKVSEYWNESFMKNVRQKMLDGEKMDICSNCYDSEKATGKSKRTKEVNSFLKRNSLKEFDFDKLTTTGLEPSHLDIRPGALCNLSCLMCGPSSSTKRFAEVSKLKLPFYPKPNKPPPEFKIEWFDNLDFDFNKIEELQLLGGEPTIMNETFLKYYLSVQNEDKKYLFRFNTNGMIINDEITKMMKNFNNTRAAVSLDAYGVVNDYIRFPSKWNIIEENIKHYSKYATRLEFSITLQAHNVFYISELIEWIIINYPNSKFFVNTLTYPSFLVPEIIPFSYRQKIADNLNGDHFKNFKDLLLVDDEVTDLQIQQFKDYCKRIDKVRGTNLYKTLPELGDVINEL